MRIRGIALAATTLSIAWCASAWADEATEKALQQVVEEQKKRLDDQQKQIDELARRMGDGSSKAGDELEANVANLMKATKYDKDGVFGYWKNGFKFDSVNGAFKFQVFGRIQVDFVGWDNGDRDDDNQTALGETNASTEFRRVRLGAGGTMYKNVEYKAEFDFADQGNGTAAFADVMMQVNNIAGAPVNFRVGHFDEPFSLERLTSSKYTTFAERSLVEGSGMVPGRNTGMMFLGQAVDGRLAWFAGAFRDANAYGNDVSPAHPGQHALTARVAGRPYVSEDGTEFVHLGIGATRRNPMNEAVQYRARPEVHVGPRFVDTGALAVDRITAFDFEAGANFGPFHAQAEFVTAALDGKNKTLAKAAAEDHDFKAWSVQVGYFLTGENREYDAKMARWDRIKTKKNFDDAGGMGAWELAARVSEVDLDDGDVEGGKMRDLTLGVNWYLNPQTRIMFNWIHFDPDRELTVSGKNYDLETGNAFVLTFRIDF